MGWPIHDSITQKPEADKELIKPWEGSCDGVVSAHDIEALSAGILGSTRTKVKLSTNDVTNLALTSIVKLCSLTQKKKQEAPMKEY